MIRIGYSQEQKRELITKLMQENKYDRLFVFYGQEQPDFDFEGIETFYCPWSETEMYRTFYPLLGNPYKGSEHVPAITKDSLLIVDEMLMTKNRSDLKYNCTHHFLRVSHHHVVFNWLPIIDSEQDFMILLDYDKPDRYKGRGISDSLYLAEDCQMVSRMFDLNRQQIQITDKQRSQYQNKLLAMFEEVESSNKDPDIIPRNMAKLCGNYKKPAIEPGLVYIARDSRFKAANVYTYKNSPRADNVILLDMHFRYSEFIKMLRHTDPKHITYISTGLSADEYYYNDMADWKERIEHIYGCAGLPE